jgi:putative ABC transport system permease protein
MTRAFRLNLTALSLLALLVGAFPDLQHHEFSGGAAHAHHRHPAQRGRRPARLVRAILSEALVVGVPGTLAWLLLGALLGSGLTGLVVQTIDDLYFRLRVDALALSGWPFAKAAVLGLGATLLAALGPGAGGRKHPATRRAVARLDGAAHPPAPAVAAGRLPLIALAVAQCCCWPPGAIRCWFPLPACSECSSPARFATPPATAALMGLLGARAARAPAGAGAHGHPGHHRLAEPHRRLGRHWRWRSRRWSASG